MHKSARCVQVSTDAEVAELQARLHSVQQEAQAQAAAQQAQALGAAAAEAAPATLTAPQLSIGALLAAALPQPVVAEFALPGEYSLMRSIPYQHVDVNRYPPEHRPKKQRAGQIPVRPWLVLCECLRRLLCSLMLCSCCKVW